MKKSKLIGAIIGVMLFSFLIVGITYAWYTWRSGNIIISGNTECFDVDYVKGKILNNESTILFDESTIISGNQVTIKNGMAITGLTAALNSECTISGNINITMTVNSLNESFNSLGDSAGAFKYILASYDPATYNDITTETLNGVTFDIIKTESITGEGEKALITDELSTTQKGYMFIFYVDGDLAHNSAQDTTFTATIGATIEQTA